MQFEKSEKAKLNTIINGLINSTLIFNNDNTQFIKELLFINNNKWKCKLEEGSIMIGTDEC